MSPVGHSLVGATVAITLWPQFEGRPKRTALLLAMIVASNIPDLPLPYWGHEDYLVSHSVFCGLLVALAIFLGLKASPLGRERTSLRRVLLAATLALASHYLLDTLYNHGKGLAMFWPFSTARIALPIPWFTHMNINQPFSWENVQIWLIELAVVGTGSLLALAIVLPRRKRTRIEEVGDD